MNPVLGLAEIDSRFRSQWVLINNPRTDDKSHVIAGEVLWHSANRDEVYTKANELRPKHFAVLFAGTVDGDMDFALFRSRSN